MNVADILIRVLKKTYREITGATFPNPSCDCDRQSANDKIFRLLDSGKPCMISRFGTTEINCVNNYLCVYRKRPFMKKCWDYITDKTHTPWWNRSHWQAMYLWSGIFPPGLSTAEHFSEQYLADIPEIDLLGCHQYYEKFMPLRENVTKVQLETLYPFFVKRPWTRYLHGKKVLVVHPFEATIKQQYQRRKALFDNPDVLPDFELITLKSVQTIAGNKSLFRDWFEALAYMENQISSIDFDICLLGCGAYGLPLAAHVKRMGRQAVHLGGGLQLLFGIKGKRWVEQYPDVLHYLPGVNIHTNYRSLFNNQWVYPLPEDKPARANIVENGCYWN